MKVVVSALGSTLDDRVDEYRYARVEVKDV